MKYLKRSVFIILALMFTLKSFAIKPIKTYPYTPDVYDINYTQRKVKVDSLITLNSWHLQPVINKKNITILFSYGDAGNMSYSLMQAASLYDLGYDVVLYDYRGFGQSTDYDVRKDMLFDMSYVDDLAAVYNYYQKILPRQKMIFMSLSMGTIVNTIFLAKQEIKDQTFIYEGFVSSIDKAVSYLNNANKPTRSSIKDLDYLEYVERLKLNKGLIFNGSMDRLCQLTDEIKSAFEIVNFEGGHLQGFYKLTEDGITGNIYNKYIDDFIRTKK